MTNKDKTVRITANGLPHAKGRPKIGRLPNGRPIAFTPKDTRDYESYLKFLASQEMGGRPLLEGALHVFLQADVQIPASFSGRKRALALAGHIRPTPRPDLDNYLKSALDAFNGIIYRDDSAVVETHTRKIYSDKPRLIVEVSCLCLS